MEPISKIRLIQHALGAGALGGMYSIQVGHIITLIGVSVISIVYLFCLFAYYCIQYGCESKIVIFDDEESKRLNRQYRLGLIMIGVVFSFVELTHNDVPHNSWGFWLRAGFSVLGVIFPEHILKLIFGISIR